MINFLKTCLLMRLGMNWKNDPSDYVNFVGTAKDGHRQESGSLYGNCYSKLTYDSRQLNEWDILCSPYSSVSMPKENYLKLARAFKKETILPKSTKAYHKDGKNYLAITASDDHHFYVYSTLCFYRWADTGKGLMGSFYDHYFNKKLNFYISLQIAVRDFCSNSNHSFAGGGHYYRSSPLSRALALYSIFRFRESAATYLSKSIEQSVEKITKIIDPSRKLEADLLDPKLSRLFELGNPLTEYATIIEEFNNFKAL